MGSVLWHLTCNFRTLNQRRIQDFPWGAPTSKGGGANSRGGYVSKILYVKTKESGPLGGRAPAAPPPGSATDFHLNILRNFIRFPSEEFSINIFKSEPWGSREIAVKEKRLINDEVLKYKIYDDKSPEIYRKLRSRT